MTVASPGYPPQFEADVVLSDGGTVLIRPIRPDDRAALVRFHHGLSPESVYLRYFSPHPHLSDAELEFLTTLDYRWRMALVAILGDEIVAVARYEGKEGTTSAEVAFLVDDHHHGRGIGTVLLEWLAAAAREAGVTTFYATTLPFDCRRGGGPDPDERRPPGVPEPAERRLPGPRLSRELEVLARRRRPGLPVGARHPRRRRPGHHLRARRHRSRGAGTMRRQARRRNRHDHRRVRRSRRRRRRCRAGTDSRRPPARNAGDRSQLHGGHQHRPRGLHERPAPQRR